MKKKNNNEHNNNEEYISFIGDSEDVKKKIKLIYKQKIMIKYQLS